VEKQALESRERGDAAQTQADTLQQGLATVASIRSHPGLEALGANGAGRPGLGGVGTVTGKVAELLPGTDRRDLKGLVDTLKSQQFLTGIKQMQGMGALSNAEGDKIASAVASLDLDQSLSGFKNALGVIESTLRRSEARTNTSGRLPTTGGPLVMKHPRFGNVNEGEVNRLMRSNPGATRDQVLQYLRETGGK
jgi:hypothetical protein